MSKFGFPITGAKPLYGTNFLSVALSLFAYDITLFPWIPALTAVSATIVSCSISHVWSDHIYTNTTEWHKRPQVLLSTTSHLVIAFSICFFVVLCWLVDPESVVFFHFSDVASLAIILKKILAFIGGKTVVKKLWENEIFFHKFPLNERPQNPPIVPNFSPK
jgi:hypothetical protein